MANLRMAISPPRGESNDGMYNIAGQNKRREDQCLRACETSVGMRSETIPYRFIRVEHRFSGALKQLL